jgi:uncharacterized Tic20 family protein
MSASTPAPDTGPTGTPTGTPTDNTTGATTGDPAASPVGEPYGGPHGDPAPTGMKPADERTWAMLAHLGSFVAAYIALGLIAPLIVLLVKGNESAYVRAHSVESLNFQITALIAALVTIPFVFILIGIPVLIIIGVLYLIWVIQASLAANRGEYYRYPVNWRIVK